MDIVVDVADMKITDDPGATLVTYALGSCIGLTIWDPKAKIGGMLHYMLPESQLSPQRAAENPFMFADTGVPRLFRQAYALGANKRRLQIKAAGGSELMDSTQTFNIGKRNYLMLRKLFWKNNVTLDAEDVGGSVHRTVRLIVATGQVIMKIPGRGEVEL